jgi:hypothetical protein
LLETELEHFARNIRLRAMFEDKQERNSPFYVPNPAYMPATACTEVEAFIQDVNTAMRDCFVHERKVVAQVPLNMTAEQESALKTLKEDNDIIIKPADKNLGLCIVDKAWYVNECSKILANQDTYTRKSLNSLNKL